MIKLVSQRTEEDENMRHILRMEIKKDLLANIYFGPRKENHVNSGENCFKCS